MLKLAPKIKTMSWKMLNCSVELKGNVELYYSEDEQLLSHLSSHPLLLKILSVFLFSLLHIFVSLPQPLKCIKYSYFGWVELNIRQELHCYSSLMMPQQNAVPYPLPRLWRRPSLGRQCPCRPSRGTWSRWRPGRWRCPSGLGPLCSWCGRTRSHPEGNREEPWNSQPATGLLRSSR